MKLKFPRKESFSFTTESLGILNCFFPLSLGDQKELYNRTSKNLENVAAEDYVRALISVTCYPAISDEEQSLKPTSYSLSVSDTARLYSIELEEFSKKYIEANDYLFREHIVKTEPRDGEPGTAVSMEYGKVEHQKKENETDLAYLYRLSLIQEKRLAEQFAKLTAGVTGGLRNLARQFEQPFHGFSNDLKSQMEKTLNIGRSLHDSFEQIKSTKVYPVEYKIPNIDLDKLQKQTEEARMQPTSVPCG